MGLWDRVRWSGAGLHSADESPVIIHWLIASSSNIQIIIMDHVTFHKKQFIRSNSRTEQYINNAKTEFYSRTAFQVSPPRKHNLNALAN